LRFFSAGLAGTEPVFDVAASLELSSAPPKHGWGLAILKGCGRTQKS
jgi:hypothetical protein